MSVTREHYHHGELRDALIRAASEIIHEKGIEGFSLRAAARRAGVSPGAPAHHFGTSKGLLTEVALAGYQQLGEYLARSERSGDPAGDIAQISFAYIQFALDHPGVFRLMFRHDLVDRNDSRYDAISTAAFKPFSEAAQAYRQTEGMEQIEEKPAMFALWSATHGMAHLVLEEKVKGLFEISSLRDWADHQLPRVLKSIWHMHSGKRS